MFKIALGIVLLAHGIGHSMGPLQSLRVAEINPSWDGDSWLLTSAVGPAATQAIGVLVWGVAMIGFAGLAAVVIGWLPAAWWVPLAIASAAISILGVALFPRAFPTFSTVGALAVDLAVLTAVTWFHWSPSDLAA